MDFGTFKLVPKKNLKKWTPTPRNVVTFTYKTEQPTGAIVGRKALISVRGTHPKFTLKAPSMRMYEHLSRNGYQQLRSDINVYVTY